MFSFSGNLKSLYGHEGSDRVNTSETIYLTKDPVVYRALIEHTKNGKTLYAGWRDSENKIKDITEDTFNTVKVKSIASDNDKGSKVLGFINTLVPTEGTKTMVEI